MPALLTSTSTGPRSSATAAKRPGRRRDRPRRTRSRAPRRRSPPRPSELPARGCRAPRRGRLPARSPGTSPRRGRIRPRSRSPRGRRSAAARRQPDLWSTLAGGSDLRQGYDRAMPEPRFFASLASIHADAGVGTGRRACDRRGDGCFLFDSDGRRYIDGDLLALVQRPWPPPPAHRCGGAAPTRPHRALDDARAHAPARRGARPPAGGGGARLRVRSPRTAQSRVFYSDSGSTAVEVALKMAFQYWQQSTDRRPERTRFVCLEDAYHGDTIGSVSVGRDRAVSLAVPAAALR